MDSMQKPIESLYFNDNYDNDFIMKNLYSLSAYLYSTNVHRQESLTGMQLLTGPTGTLVDFYESRDLTIKLKLDPHTFVCPIPIDNINYDNYKSLANTYIDWYKYGNSSLDSHKVAFTQDEMLKRNMCVKNRLLVFIDGRIYPKVDYFIDRKYLYVIIPTTKKNNTQYSEDEFRHLQYKKTKWSLLITKPASFANTDNFVPSRDVTTGSFSDDIKIQPSFNKSFKPHPNPMLGDVLWIAGVGDNTSKTLHLTIATVDYGTGPESANSPGQRLFYGYKNFTKNYINFDNGQFFASAIHASKILHPVPWGPNGDTYTFSQASMDNNGDIWAGREEVPQFVSPKSMIVFERNTNTDEFTLVHDAVIRYQYPGIFKIENVEKFKDLYVLVSYYGYIPELCTNYKYIEVDANKVRNPLQFYIKYLQSALCPFGGSALYMEDAFINKKVPALIYSYLPQDFKFSQKDMISNRYVDGAVYTLDKLVRLGLNAPDNLHELYEKRFNENYHHVVLFDEYMGDVWDSSRIRTSPTDITNPSFGDDWLTPRYLFTINHSTNDYLNSICVWVDNIRCDEFDRALQGTTEYIYVPTAYVTNTSYVKIESFITKEDDAKEYQMTFTLDEIRQNFPRVNKLMSGRHLLCYNAETYEIIPNSLFKFMLSEDDSIVGLGTTEKYGDHYALAGRTVYPDREILTLNKNSYRDHTNSSFYKYVPTVNLKVTMDNPDYFDTPIIFKNTDIYRKIEVENVNNVLSIPLNWWDLSRDGDNFRISVNGKVQAPGIDYDIIEDDGLGCPIFHINTKDDLYYLIENMNNGTIDLGTTVYLLADITVDGDFVPLEYFAGTFFGYDYTISNIPYTSTESTFIVNNTGTIENLRLIYNIKCGEGNVVPNVDEITIVRYNEGTINCSYVYGYIPDNTQFTANKIEILTDEQYQMSKYALTYNKNSLYMISITEIPPAYHQLDNPKPATYSSPLIVNFRRMITTPSKVIIEYMPYKHVMVGVVKNNHENIIVYPDIDRPLSHVYHTFYIDGKLVGKGTIIIISNCSFKVNAEDWDTLTIFSHGRDDDIYGRVYNPMTLTDRLLQQDENFKAWLNNEFKWRYSQTVTALDNFRNNKRKYVGKYGVEVVGKNTEEPKEDFPPPFQPPESIT